MNKNYAYAEFLKRLKEIRKEKKIKQQTMAEVIGLTYHSEYSRRENGQTDFTVPELILLNNYLRATWAELFGSAIDSRLGDIALLYRDLPDDKRDELLYITEALHNKYGIVQSMGGTERERPEDSKRRGKPHLRNVPPAKSEIEEDGNGPPRRSNRKR